MKQLRLWLSSLDRQRKVEIVAVFAAGIGIGIAAGALASSSPNARRSTPTSNQSAQSETRTTSTLPAASAGIQPEHTPSTTEATKMQQAAEPVLAPGSVASFDRLNAGLGNGVELAVAPLGVGGTEVLGEDRAAHGWSTTKVPVLTALLKARGNQGLSSEEEAWAHSAITESSNQSVVDLFDDLEQVEGGLTSASSYVDELFRESGDTETTFATAPPPPNAVTRFGQTLWRPSQAVKFFSALARGCLLSQEDTHVVLDLMEHIVPSESWGLGTGGFSSVAFKGGWGPEPREPYAWIVRQSGIVDVRSSSRAVAVAIVAFASSFEAGIDMLNKTAAWLDVHLQRVSRPKLGCTAG